MGVCIRLFEARALSLIVFGVALGRGPVQLAKPWVNASWGPPPLVDSRTGQLARAYPSISKPVVAPDMTTRRLGATPANSSREDTSLLPPFDEGPPFPFELPAYADPL